MKNTKLNSSGFSLVEVIVVSALMLLVFLALFASVTYILGLINNSQARLSALSLATDRIEYIRSLPYDSVGTIAGIPSGSIPQNSTTTLNGIEFSERVLIQFVDDPADGFGPADGNGIVADYKEVKVEYSWQIGTEPPESLFLVSKIVPRSIETNAGGGTIRVRVEDYLSNPMSGASVRVVNNTTTSTIDVTRLTDATGYALFAGAPAAADYEVYVSRAGYSSDQTYAATTSLPISYFPLITLLESDITDLVFIIDRLSDLKVRSHSAFSELSLDEDFSLSSSITASSTDVEVIGGQLVLENVGGIYDASGTAILNVFAPGSIDRWGGLYIDHDLTANTSYTVQFYADEDDSSLIPDSDLPGNSSGLSGPYISLRQLEVASYPGLRININLSTSDNSETPEIDNLSLWYVETATPRVGQTINVVGNKNIGELGDGTLVPKYSASEVTGPSGEIELNDIEWDGYTISSGGLDVAMICMTNPTAVAPDSSNVVDVLFVPDQPTTARVRVMAGGVVLPGATVELRRPSFNQTATTGICGQVFFNSGVADEVDYELEVSAPGYGSTILNAQSVSGDTFFDVTL